MTPQYKAMMKKLRSNTVKETTQATRNIRKYKRRIEVAPKGRMVTDDYGNKLSVKKKADGTFGRRHTLSRGKERAHRLAINKDLDKKHHTQRKENIRNNIGSFSNRTLERHDISATRRRNATYPIPERLQSEKIKAKRIYHSASATGGIKNKREQAAVIHKGTKRKPKNFRTLQNEKN